MPLFRRNNRPRPRTFSQPKWRVKHRRSHSLRFRQLIQGKVLLSLGVIILIGLGIYGFFFTDLLHIQRAGVSTEYKDVRTENLEKFLLGQVQGINTFYINLNEIAGLVYENFPEVSALNCQRQALKKAISCEAIGFELVAVIKHEGNKYYINENGVVIAYDERKLGLPIFDLILNPVYADLASSGEIKLAEPEAGLPDESGLEPVLGPQPEPMSLTEIILGERGGSDKTIGTMETIGNESPSANSPNRPNSPNSLTFITPFDAPPLEPVIQDESREVFQVSPGKKILDPEELKAILEAIKELEEVLQRKVIHAQYVQVAGELSLTSKPGTPQEADPKETDPNLRNDPNVPDSQAEQAENPDHELTFLLDLRRNLDEQFNKLKKAKEVINFSEATRIDLSVDGEKVFYR